MNSSTSCLAFFNPCTCIGARMSARPSHPHPVSVPLCPGPVATGCLVTSFRKRQPEGFLPDSCPFPSIFQQCPKDLAVATAQTQARMLSRDRFFLFALTAVFFLSSIQTPLAWPGEQSARPPAPCRNREQCPQPRGVKPAPSCHVQSCTDTRVQVHRSRPHSKQLGISLHDTAPLQASWELHCSALVEGRNRARHEPSAVAFSPPLRPLSPGPDIASSSSCRYSFPC